MYTVIAVFQNEYLYNVTRTFNHVQAASNLDAQVQIANAYRGIIINGLLFQYVHTAVEEAA